MEVSNKVLPGTHACLQHGTEVVCLNRQLGQQLTAALRPPTNLAKRIESEPVLRGSITLNPVQ